MAKAVKKAPVAAPKKAPIKKPAVAAAASTSFDDPYSTKAFKSAVRTNTIKHKRVYAAIKSLDIAGKDDVLAAINAAHTVAKRKLHDNVEQINAEAAKEPQGTVADDLG